MSIGSCSRFLKDGLSGRVEHGNKSGPMSYLNTHEEEGLATFLKEALNIRLILSLHL